MEIKKGDIFILGKHRLMCGDSLSLMDVQKLLDGQTADMIFTDPPYNVNYSDDKLEFIGKTGRFGKIMNDTNFEITKVMEIIHTGLCKGAVYMCHGTNQRDNMYDFVYEKFKIRPIDIIWVKNGTSMIGLRDYCSQYESIMYYYYPGKKFRGDKGQTDVWFFKRRSTAKYIHPTQKPVAMIQRAIMNSSDEGDIVMDLFGGSGSTMVACENTERRAYIMELDVKYVDVIIKRWEALTGQEAIKV